MGILEKMRLDGKAALVTGGARGIGRSVATAFAEAGADVVLADIDLAEAERAAKEIADATGRKIIAVRADVTSPTDCAAMVEAAVAAFGKLDIAMCNAGICKNTPAIDMTPEEFKQVIDINLTGVFLTAQAAGRQMMRQGTGGSIINTASMSAHIVNVPQPQCSYNASKAGVIQLTKSLAVEWADENIRVNSLSPGYIGTELVLASDFLKPLIPQWNASAPLRRLGTPEELQAICVYLAGDAAAFTTGTDFVVDGAFTCI
jgi:NAD(P)-dependent dehydrogenase (short-subunit alcohol dehydrogenase family)